MTTFFKFVDTWPTVAGFYVLKYKEGHEKQVYLGTPKYHYGNIYSYPATYHNCRDENTCHDMGQYIWVNSYDEPYGPTEWRRMTTDEALAFSETLFMFGRPSWAHPNGRQHLTAEDIK